MADPDDGIRGPITLTFEDLKKHPHTRDDGSWWMHDARGLPLCRVCVLCEEAKKTKYNPWVFTGYDQAFLDEESGERIEDDY